MNENVKELICLTGNYPDGQKIDGVKLVYASEVEVAGVDVSAYAVEERNITGVTVEGNTVTLALNIRDRKASIIADPGPRGPGGPGGGPGGPGGPGGGPGGPGRGGPPRLPTAKREPREVRLTQVKDILTADGSVPAWTSAETTQSAVEPVIDHFQQFDYKGLGYNLFVPACYDGTKALPLVVFIHDAGPCGPDTKITLSQGNGAITWAKPEWQTEHPCFVLAPQIPRTVKLTADNFQASPEIHILKEMIDIVVEKYGIDSNRIYTTGQSMGCMASCELNILYPDFFAASLLVAGQWSPERMAEKCSACKMWILVSNHDIKAFPGMNAVTEAMEAAGARIGRYLWNAKSNDSQFDELVAKALEDDVNIRYTVFEGSSVVPSYKPDNPATNHVCTWPVVYEIEGVKKWLFSCSKM